MNKAIDPKRIEEIEAAVKAATPGPWVYAEPHHGNNEYTVSSLAEGTLIVTDCNDEFSEVNLSPEDLKFVAMSRTAIPELLAEREEREEEIERLHQLHRDELDILAMWMTRAKTAEKERDEAVEQVRRQNITIGLLENEIISTRRERDANTAESDNAALREENERLEDEHRMYSERHGDYLNQMGPILEDIREKRSTGEPAQSDFYEVRKLRVHAESAEKERDEYKKENERYLWMMKELAEMARTALGIKATEWPPCPSNKHRLFHKIETAITRAESAEKALEGLRQDHKIVVPLREFFDYHAPREGCQCEIDHEQQLVEAVRAALARKGSDGEMKIIKTWHQDGPPKEITMEELRAELESDFPDVDACIESMKKGFPVRTCYASYTLNIARAILNGEGE